MDPITLAAVVAGLGFAAQTAVQFLARSRRRAVIRRRLEVR